MSIRNRRTSIEVTRPRIVTLCLSFFKGLPRGLLFLHFEPISFTVFLAPAIRFVEIYFRFWLLGIRAETSSVDFFFIVTFLCGRLFFSYSFNAANSCVTVRITTCPSRLRFFFFVVFFFGEELYRTKVASRMICTMTTSNKGVRFTITCCIFLLLFIFLKIQESDVTTIQFFQLLSTETSLYVKVN